MKRWLLYFLLAVPLLLHSLDRLWDGSKLKINDINFSLNPVAEISIGGGNYQNLSFSMVSGSASNGGGISFLNPNVDIDAVYSRFRLSGGGLESDIHAKLQNRYEDKDPEAESELYSTAHDNYLSGCQSY
jgi:hypothetical protein